MIGHRQKRRRITPGVERLESWELLSATFVGGVWTITGSNRADTLVVDRDPGAPEMLRAFQNGKLIDTRAASSVTEFRMRGLGGNDTLKVDESHGAIRARAVLQGGGGRNVLVGGSGSTVLDGGPSRNSVLQAGAGQTTFLQGVSADSVSRFGSTRAFRQFLTKSAAKYGTRNYTPVSTVGGGTTGTPTTVASPSPNPSGNSIPDHSTTRVQVPGVDEADIVETDGSYLYLLSRGELVIVDARQADALSVASRTTMEGYPIAEYLDGNRLTVITSIWNTDPLPVDGAAIPSLVVRGAGQVRITTFDVSDRSRPQTLQTTTLDGTYSDSRMVDGKLYLVVQNNLFTGNWTPGGGVITPIARATPRRGGGSAGATGTAALANAPIDRILPGYTTTSGGAARAGLISQPGDIYRPAVGDDANLMSVVVLDTRGSTPGPIGTASLLGSYASTLHVTADTLYVFSPRWDETGSTTSIAQFSLAGTNPTLVATGTVPGTLIDQYSADAYQGDLRVATTTWNSNGGGPTSGLYVLRPQGGRLNVIGSIDGIAPGEQLFAARFDGPRAYLVTFLQVDPLFTIDLANPTAPQIKGELVLPGFSRFLQPVGNGLLLGIGREADPNTGRTTDLKLSLFDVRDLSQPSLVASQTIVAPNTDWTWSDAEWDPHALGWFPEKGLLAVPVQGIAPYTVGGDGGFIDWKTVSDLYVFRLDTSATAGSGAFNLLGKVAHDSGVTRSVRIGDILYSIADQDVRSVRVVDAGLNPLGQVVIQTAPTGGPGVIAFATAGA